MQDQHQQSPALGPETPQIEIIGVHKSFGPTRALIDVSLTVARGEARALLGRNGAGKSTLVAMLTGLLRPDQGEVRIAGVAAADARSVSCVYQHSRLVPALTVAENVVMGRYPRGFAGGIKWRQVTERAEQRLSAWDLAGLANMLVQDLDPVQAKVVEICRALAQDPRVLLLDEPTAGLDRKDASRLFEFVDRLKDEDVTLIYVSHHIDEVYRLCDSATVLRDARHVVTAPLSELPKPRLVAAMIGDTASSDLSEFRKPRAAAQPKLPTGLSVRGLSVEGRVEDFSFEVGRGECIGIAGLEGSGKAEVGAALAGLLKPSSGSIEVAGTIHPPGDVRDALEAGIGYVPQNRHAQGMVAYLSVAENATMTAARRLARVLIPGLLKILLPSDRDRVFLRLAEQWKIVASAAQQPIGELSGGNQQKCVMARALAAEPQILVLQNPTAGVDVAAKASIMRSLESILAKGASVVVISEDADDFALASRVLTINKGRLGAELASDWTDHDLVAAMQGGLY